MNISTETTIEEYEQSLKLAMLQSDIVALDQLLSDGLVFTNHIGNIFTKESDIEAHKSKILEMKEITLSEQQIRTYGNVAVVTVKAYIVGSFEGTESSNSFRFTRVWEQALDNNWKVITAHSSIIS